MHQKELSLSLNSFDKKILEDMEGVMDDRNDPLDVCYESQ